MMRASRALFSKTPAWATINPFTLSASSPGSVQNLVEGEWRTPAKMSTVVDPLNGEAFLSVPATAEEELAPFVSSLKSCPKSGRHNPFKNVERYLMYGDVCKRAARDLEENEDFWVRLIQRVMPKSDPQARAEVKVTREFLENFNRDRVRFLAKGNEAAVPGDRVGQTSTSVRWPYGPVAIISPFNFPLEIPVLQLMGALFMGNKPVLKNASSTCVVVEQFVRLLIECDMPAEDVDLIHCSGGVMGQLVNHASDTLRMTQFTGSSQVAELLASELHGKVKIEDAGFDWKIINKDAALNLEAVAKQCDQDAYAASGQKCSAQSIAFVHSDVLEPLTKRMAELASERTLESLEIGPVLTHTTRDILQHCQELQGLNGARLLFGGHELSEHSIPKQYGAVLPTAMYVPLEEILRNEDTFALCTREIFGPFQVVTSFDDASLDQVLEACERMKHHLTAGIVSQDPRFVQKVLGNTVNGTIYTGMLARTTGAPANHNFGPAGDPRGAGIGTDEAIKMVWSTNREIIYDHGSWQ